MGVELCCCEYINNRSEKSHLLACCCDCKEVDSLFTGCISCQDIDSLNVREMLLTFQDRLRIPWHGGAKQVSFGALIPIVAIPLAFAVAAINGCVTAIICISSTTFIAYVYYYISRRNLRTRFFCVWIFWSVVYMALLFELTVPLLELLPEENLILVILALGALYCLWQTHRRAVLNNVTHGQLESSPNETESTATAGENETLLSDQTTLLLEPETLEGTNFENTMQKLCKYCHKSTVTDHCFICSSCVLHRRHHSYWLDCCIGEWNYKYYLFGLFFAELALLLGCNLTLTAICHPFLVIRFGGVPIMLPDDCSGVYDDYKLSVAFVIAIYALLIAVFILLVLIRQFYILLRRGKNSEYDRNIFRQKKPLWRSFL